MTKKKSYISNHIGHTSKKNNQITKRLTRILHIRNTYKDRLFIRLFEDKTALLSLYNALNGTSYTDTSLLTITTLDDFVYLGFKNDCSFIIGNYLNLYEHQSTMNPNMPIRGFNYFADIFRAYIKLHRLDIYGRHRIVLPTPRYIIFYNGEEDIPDQLSLRLSDSFKEPDGCLECTATVININLGHNNDILKGCQTLLGYSQLIDKIREYITQGHSHGKAVDLAITYCIDHNILYDFLAKHRAEVVKMFDTDYSMRKYRKMVEYNHQKELSRVIAEKDAEIAEMQTEIMELKQQLAKRDASHT